ncbi:MAG TPA: 4-alpha-glucanotransferase [Mycobacteriales bacterium]|nr:4-alpha-glucanotransferase [Mycobacteriales bacterium]
MTAATSRRELRELARLRGVQLSYTGHDGKAVRASADTLAGVLGALGHPVPDAAAISTELAAAREEQETRVLDPVVVSDQAGRLSSPLRLPRGVAASRCRLTVQLEAGGTTSLGSSELPPGYHQLVVEGPGVSAEALLLVPPPRLPRQRGLAVMAPLYALRGRDDWGVGSYADLADFAELAASWGADLVGSLPLFATSTRTPIDPSPYLPTTRMFWNELYVDLAAAARLAGCEASGDPLRASHPDPDTIRTSSEVDYEAVVRAKRQALGACAESIDAMGGRRRDDFERFVASHPELSRYADFRAANERTESGWRSWPAAPGRLPEGSVDPAAARYYRFAQYAAATQLTDVAERGAAQLYLDLPVGVHGDGFDAWSRSDLFAGAEVGAPPDAFFAGGQAWGFPPLHPERLRLDRYSYFIDAVRQVLRYARAIRIDHILGLQRLYWIPSGADAGSGAYVRYHDDELRAIVAIEAHRAGAMVVGEDLGIVPPGIRAAMDRDGFLHTFVYQFAASPADPFPQPRRPSAASVGSHDLPRFATFWQELDVEQRRAIGASDPPSALRSCLASLARGPSAYVVVDVADLEGEVVPDNRPGTGPEAGNWRRRLPRSIAELAADDDLRDLMSGLAAARTAPSTNGVSR